MVMVALVLAVYAGYSVTVIREAVRSKKPGVLWPCLVFFFAGLAVQCLHEMKINVPGPNEPIYNFFTGWLGIR